MITVLQLRLYAYLAIAIVLAGFGLRMHWVGVGEQTTRTAWDKQKKADADRALQLAQDAARDQATRNRNAERTADEDHRREQDRLARLAAAQRTADGLLDALAKLDSDDLSAAAADPRVAAVAQRAIAARELLGRCSSRYTSLAGRADRLRDQVTGLRDFALNVCHAGGEPGTETPESKDPAQ